MDLGKYKVLLQVLETGGLSKAAQETGYTISGISRILTSLEKEFGFALLHRQHDGIQPTKELTLLLPYMQELVYQQKVLEEVCQQIKGANLGTITIGVAYSKYYRSLANMTAAYQKENPYVHFQFEDGYSSELIEKMHTHQIDICLVSEREGSHVWKQIGLEEIVAWIPHDHPLAASDRISLKAFKEEAYIDIYPGQDIDNARLLQKNHITPNSTISMQDSFAAYSMVDAGLGVSLNHKSSCENWKGDVLTKSLDPPVYIPIGLAMNQNASPLVREFWEYMISELLN